MIGGRPHEDETAADALAKVDLREAYDRGRRDERAARKRRPILMTITFVLALIGVAILALAAVNGSFTRAGGVIDEQLNIAAQRAGPAARQAASNAGQSLRDAGRTARSRATPAG
jgi:hypothetical protein